MKIDKNKISKFRTKIRKFYRQHGRELPFRMIDDSYKVTVSEIMLQQTQVDRVIPKYNNWIHKFPNWQSLAQASNKEILTYWSGLGYNRRAIYLKNIAQILVEEYNGKMPEDINTLQSFPGIGKYTSYAILIFAFGKRLATVDTNIRKVLLHEFNLSADISDKEIQTLAEIVLPQTKIKEWHYALMDYAKTLPKEIHIKYQTKYKQSKFEGSIRQIRGEIIRQLTKNKFVTINEISINLKRTENDIKKAIETLQYENIITLKKNKIYLNND